jgi:hypothetical protein
MVYYPDMSSVHLRVRHLHNILCPTPAYSDCRRHAVVVAVERDTHGRQTALRRAIQERWYLEFVLCQLVREVVNGMRAQALGVMVDRTLGMESMLEVVAFGVAMTDYSIRWQPS